MLIYETDMKISRLLLPALWTKAFSPKLPLVTMKPRCQIWYCSVFEGCHGVFGLWKFIMGRGPRHAVCRSRWSCTNEIAIWNSQHSQTALWGIQTSVRQRHKTGLYNMTRAPEVWKIQPVEPSWFINATFKVSSFPYADSISVKGTVSLWRYTNLYCMHLRIAFSAKMVQTRNGWV